MSKIDKITIKESKKNIKRGVFDDCGHERPEMFWFN
jgi:hypothetical protein